MRLLPLLISSQSGEAAKSAIRSLQESYGSPMIIEEIMEENAIDKLKKLEDRLNGR